MFCHSIEAALVKKIGILNTWHSDWLFELLACHHLLRQTWGSKFYNSHFWLFWKVYEVWSRQSCFWYNYLSSKLYTLWWFDSSVGNKSKILRKRFSFLNSMDKEYILSLVLYRFHVMNSSLQRFQVDILIPSSHLNHSSGV